MYTIAPLYLLKLVPFDMLDILKYSIALSYLLLLYLCFFPYIQSNLDGLNSMGRGNISVWVAEVLQ